MKSEKFKAAIFSLIEASECLVMGAVTAPIYGHRVPFCDEITAHADVEVHRIKKSNRDAVADEIEARVLKSWADHPTMSRPSKKRRL